MPRAPRAAVAAAVVLSRLLIAAPPLHAQSPAERAQLEEFRHALAEASTAEQVQALTTVTPAGTTGPLGELRRAFALIRTGEVTGERAPLDEALSRLDAAEARRPDWIYPWLGLALAKLDLHARDALVKSTPRNQPDGLNYYEGYLAAFAQVFARDSLFPPAIAVIRQVMARQGERGQPAMFLDAIRRVAFSRTGTATDALLLARDYRRREQGDTALRLLDLYLRRGGDRGLAGLERGRTLAGLDSLDAAASAYLEGLQSVSPESRAALREDLGWIATPGELAAFDRAPDDSLADWVLGFWRWRDVHEMRQTGERLEEHLRRWAWVDRHYRVVSPERRIYFTRMWNRTGGACDRGDYWLADNILGDSVQRPWDGRHRERLYDDRAYLYMRHGAPVRSIRSMVLDQHAHDVAGPNLPAEIRKPTVRDQEVLEFEAGKGGPTMEDRRDDARANESWLYYLDGERRVYSFEGSKALGTAAPTTLVSEPLPDEDYLWARGELDPAYNRVAHELDRHSAVPFNCRRAVRELALQERSNARLGLTTDSYVRLFRRQLEPVVQTYALGRPDLGTGYILVVFALPGQQLAAHHDSAGPSGVWYPVSARLGAADSASHFAVSLDTVRNYLAPSVLRAGSHLIGAYHLAVPSGRFDLSASFFQPEDSVGGSVVRTGMDLRRQDDGLYLSDVVLGRDGSGLVWIEKSDTIALNPLGAFTTGQVAQLYYELSGLEPGREYSHQIELYPVKDPKSPDRVRLSFREAAADGSIRVHRSLGLEQLEPGQYQLRVAISEVGSSRRVVREQYLTILRGSQPQ